jgi:sec-independent protein translocase protein TatA
MLGMGEWLIILLIVLVVFGASKLPQIGDGLGRAIKNFKKAASGQDELEVSKKREIASRGDGDVDDADIVAPRKSEKRQ